MKPARRRDYLRSYHFKRYAARRFKNPYFQHQQKPSVWPARLRLASIGLGVVCVIYLLAFAPFWMIREVRVEGLQYMSPTPIEEVAEMQLAKRRWLIFSQRHPWFLAEGAIVEQLNQAYAFESVEVVVKRRVLSVLLKERVSQILWYAAGQSYFVDLQGIVIRALTAEESAALTVSGPVVEGPFPLQDRLRSLPRMVNEDDDTPLPGETVLVSAGVQKVIEMNEALIANNLTPDHFAVERSTAAWARADLREGFSVLFDLTTDVNEQVTHLLAVLQQDVKNRATLEYIDVRFGNHVYVQGGE